MKPSKITYLAKKSFYFAWHRHHFLIPPRVLYKYMKSFFIAAKRGDTTSNLFANQSAYIKWYEKNMQNLENFDSLMYKPFFSFIVPSYNGEPEFLSECLDSMLNQSYKNFEIVICDDASTNEDSIKLLEKYEKNNKQINLIKRKKNGMISIASNDAIKAAKGDFIVLVDNDDVVHQDSLYYFAKALNKDKNIDFLYSDEDKIDYSGNIMEPHFKPDFSPDTLMSLNYICHLSCIRKSIVDKVGGFRSEFDGSQDYDLFLRIVENTNNIYHIEKVLYHWRQTKDSTAGFLSNKDYAINNGKKALQDSLIRRNLKGEISLNPRVRTYLTKYKHNNPKVSIIIPIRDGVEITKQCIDSIYDVNTYENFEIIIADNNSELEETKLYLKEVLEQHNNVKVVNINEDFNYSRINNIAVDEATGDYVLLLNNDTKVLQPDFLDWMIGYAQLKHVGCVGIKLLYKDKSVQHAGTVLGFGGVAGHVFVACSYEDNGLFGRLCMPYDYTAVTAACMLFDKEKFIDVGGFDEKLTVALNDVDLCLSFLDKGYYNVCLSNVEMFHYESKSRGYEDTVEKHNRFLKEQEYMKNKWKNKINRDKYFSKYNF